MGKDEMPLPQMGQGQRVQLMNTFPTQGDPGNIWWVSLNADDKCIGVVATRDVEQGDMWKMLDRIEQHALKANDIAVACITEAEIAQHGDGWMLDTLDVLIPPEEITFRGHTKVYI